jgi:hypothetical protein
MTYNNGRSDDQGARGGTTCAVAFCFVFLLGAVVGILIGLAWR